MYYVEFQKMSTGYIEGTIPPQFDDAHKKLIPALGSDGVQILDGRWGRATMGRVAAQWARDRGFDGWQIWQGETFTRSEPVSLKYQVERPDNSASSATFGA